MNITVTKTTHPGTLPPADTLGFGSVFTDHMFVMDYTDKDGWHDARIVPFGPISLSPAASVLHYGTEVFEGLKAYRRPDGKKRYNAEFHQVKPETVGAVSPAVCFSEGFFGYETGHSDIFSCGKYHRRCTERLKGKHVQSIGYV